MIDGFKYTAFVQRFLFILFLFMPFSAYAETYEVTVHPIDPVGEVRTAVCDVPQQETCFLTLPYLSDNKMQEEYINIAIRFMDGIFEADFMLRGHQLSLSRKGITYFKTSFDERIDPQKLSLFFVHPADQEGLKELPENARIAEIELSVLPIQD
jgi:hypothetical protein